ncbi:MAG: hypothetical protein KGZ40_02620 [Clostridiales bacterium]|nr:hypothetical protein [Clostridiales bacterium]
METLIGIVVYGTFALGYVLMLILTERSAAAYVSRDSHGASERTTIVLITPQTTRTVAASRTRTAHAAR